MVAGSAAVKRVTSSNSAYVNTKLTPFYRLHQNRISAQRFRQKKKNEYEQLKDTLGIVQAENEKLKGKVEELAKMVKQRQEVINQHES